MVFLKTENVVKVCSLPAEATRNGEQFLRFRSNALNSIVHFGFDIGYKFALQGFEKLASFH